MRTETNPEESGKSKDVIYVSILLSVALCVGVYLLVSTVLISKDGVTFIEYAQKLLRAPMSTMSAEGQHPGYPFLILSAQQISRTITDSSSLFSWIYSAQAVALTFRLLAIISIYFIGKLLVGPRFSFWATLILVLLPLPAKFGSDALSDWPHVFFLATGMLLLIRGAMKQRWWLFGLAGLMSGVGYLIRPECVQLVIYGSFWLILQLFWPKHMGSRVKTVLALGVLLIGFCVSACPYMYLKGAVFPKKQLGQFACHRADEIIEHRLAQGGSIMVYNANVMSTFARLFSNIGESLSWLFVPALFVGVYHCLKMRGWHEPRQFFIISLIVLNIALAMWLHTRYGYMSSRHTLPLVIFTVFYIPVGLQSLALWLGQIKGKRSKGWRTLNDKSKQILFFVLLGIGVSGCMVKLFRPIHGEKRFYRAASAWLNEHSRANDLIATPDLRISFYAERTGLQYRGDQIPEQARYVVRILSKTGGMSGVAMGSYELVYKPKDWRAGIAIYKKL